MSLHAFINNNTVIEIKDITDDQYRDLAYNYQNIIDISNEDISPQVGWILQGNKLVSPPSAPMNPMEYIQKVAMKSARNFVQQMQTQFIAENIALGITQSGKTGAILGLMNKKVVLEGEPDPVSLMDSVSGECPSLTVTVKIFDHILANIEDYSSLAPFITYNRIKGYANSVRNYLGMQLLG